MLVRIIFVELDPLDRDEAVEFVSCTTVRATDLNNGGTDVLSISPCEKGMMLFFGIFMPRSFITSSECGF